MKKTRIFAVLAAMAMGLAVFGCSSGDSGGSESGTTGGTTSGSIEPNPEALLKFLPLLLTEQKAGSQIQKCL